MKKILFIFIAFLCSFCFIQAQDNQIFYYHNAEKIYLDKIENTKVIHFGKVVKPSQKDSICNRLKADYLIAEINPFIYEVSGNTDQLEKNSIISTSIEAGYITCISDMLQYHNLNILWASNEIIVRIPLEANLLSLLKNNGIPVIGFRQIGHNKQTYVIELNVTEENAIEYANKLSETGSVVWAQPSFWRFIHTLNPYYSSQWGLKNTGQYNGISSIDINVTSAWNIATGTGIKVAIIDTGVDLFHPDLINNLLPGYDATDAAYGGSNGGYGGSNSCSDDAHGTACSGIISAENNDIGIKGVAYSAKIIPVRIFYGTGLYNSTGNCVYDVLISYDTWIIDGIYKAWHDYGADILSNSWGGESSPAINDEIMAALSYGRDSLGCVVVFAAGNSNSSQIGAPASDITNILTVGAISPCGERKSPTSCDGESLGWGSNYGQHLDVMAPGVLVATTDIQESNGFNPKLPIHARNGGTKITSDFSNQDYTVWFNGTSAACPHVAGVAALILSINSNLTAQEVRTIIESTAQKVGRYNYQTTSERPNGTWHEQMGYGLVNAHAAVLAARCYAGLPIVHGSITQNTTWDTPVHAIGNIMIQNRATLTISSTVKFDSESSIVVNPGAKLILNGGTLTSACSGEMWQGITVQGAFRNGIVEVDGGIIENAVCGIQSTNGGLICTTDANFINNTIAIKIEPVPSILQRITATFKNSVFTINDNYFGNPLDFETHIKLSDTYNVAVSGCTFLNEATQKSDQLGYNSGIWSFNSPLYVTGYCPPGAPINPFTGECKGYISSKFTGFNVAISASNSGAAPDINIYNSVFTDNRYGVRLNTVDYATLRKNSFNLTQSNSYGVSINYSTGYKIEENLFQNTVITADRTVGLAIGNSGSDENEVYKNSFENLYAGQNFVRNNSTLNYFPLTGLQTLCNTFSNSQFRDIHVGDLPPLATPFVHSIRYNQGSMQNPAGNRFSQNITTQFESKSFYDIDYYYGVAPDEVPNVLGIINTYPTNKKSGCPSKIGGIPSKGEAFDLEHALTQYNEWNLEYKYWLEKLLTTNPDSEEYLEILDQVSYFSALKDNYFNAIIVAAMDAESSQRQAENSPSKFEGVDDEVGRGSLYETLRYLFNYRNHYRDNLDIIETFLAESNFHEALTTLAKMYEQFKVTEAQTAELKGLETYVLWLQQLENEQNNIYELSEKELDYLVNFVKTNTGRGTVFAHNILCELYNICIEDKMIRGLDDKMIGGLDDKMIINRRLQPTDERIDKITLVPNPTTGELRIENGELRINNVEIFDIYGKKQQLSTLNSQLSTHQINIADLPAGLYFVKISTEAGEVVRKVVKQ